MRDGVRLTTSTLVEVVSDDARFAMSSDKVRWIGILSNISTSGMLCLQYGDNQPSADLEVGSVVQFEMILPSGRVSGSAKVVRHTAQGSIAFEFEEIGEYERGHLEAYCAAPF